MRELKNAKLIRLKGAMFLIAAALASVTLIVRRAELLDALLLITAIWCFARFYYFAFYVIEKYVDSRFRFTGVIALLNYLLRESKNRNRID